MLLYIILFDKYKLLSLDSKLVRYVTIKLYFNDTFVMN